MKKKTLQSADIELYEDPTEKDAETEALMRTLLTLF